MRIFKNLFMGVFLSAGILAITSMNAFSANYVKDSDLTAETTVATGDTVILYDTSANNTVKSTIANIFASAANVGASTIVTTGALDTGSITSGFGAIDNGTSDITSGGALTLDVDGTALGTGGSINFGAGTDDSGVWWDGTNHIISSTGGINLEVVEASDYNFFESDTETMRVDFSSSTTTDTALLLWNSVTGSLLRVTLGDTDSGGTGYRALVLPNS